jgi:NAD(P)-dependent dehydrogenase (short-subunit alcohol dehydrogenase family)
MGVFSDLKDKRVVITGAASGIGLVTAQRFLAEYARIMIFDWDEKKLELALTGNPDLKGGVTVDVSDAEAVKKAFIQVDQILGGIDILISNAGISFRKPFLEIPYEQWRKVLRVNLDGMFLSPRRPSGG